MSGLPDQERICPTCGEKYKVSDNHRHPASSELPNPGPKEK